MMIVKAPWARCVAGFAALALVAAACGGGTDNDEGAAVASEELVTQETSAPPVTAAPTTAPPTTAPATTAAELPADAMELLTQAFENSATRSVRGDMQMDMGGLVSIAAQFESDGKQNFAMTMNLGAMMGADDLGIGFEVRFVEGASYVRFVVPEEMQGLVSDAMPDGWFTLDEEDAAELGIVCPSVLPGVAPGAAACQLPNDYTNQIEFVTSAEIIGEESIDGESTTHIRYVIDMAALVEASPADFEGPDGLMPFPPDLFEDGLISDVWIDQRRGLVRRASVDLGSLMESAFAELDESESEGLGEGFASLFDIANVINYYDYDADITVDALPADEIVGSFGDMMGAGPEAG